MAKQTLLEIVQDILSDMSSDEVNSISDTVESEQVARIVRSAFRDMMSNKNWPHMKRLAKLVSYSDSSLPTHMRFEEEVKELVENSLQYNKAKLGETRKKYLPVKLVTNDEFLRYVQGRNNDSAVVDIITDPTGVELLIRNDAHPTYCTSFDDTTLVFDSYDSLVDSVLQASKIQCMAYYMDSLVLADDTIPNLPSEAFSALINESTSRAAFKLDQVQDIKAEAEANKQNRWLSQKAWRASDKKLFPTYGRR